MRFSALCLALRLSRAALRFHFIDMDDLLGAILKRHLAALTDALTAGGAAGAADFAARRAAWRRMTRDDTGAFTPAHALLLQFRHSLPEDLRAPIEAAYRGLAAMLTADAAPEALALLDCPQARPGIVETMLAAPRAAEAAVPTPATRPGGVAQAGPLAAPRAGASQGGLPRPGHAGAGMEAALAENLRAARPEALRAAQRG